MTHLSKAKKVLRSLSRSRRYPLDVVQAFAHLSKKLDRSHNGKPRNRIRDLIACDAAYYKLYYWHLTNDGLNNAAFVPPPLAYFSEFENSKAGRGVLKDENLSNLNTKAKERRIQLLDCFGLAPQVNSTHVLEALHERRAKETLILADDLQTDAALLAEWKDSCRDFLCHLYAYATISTTSLNGIRSVLRGCKSIVEVGAGTGYIAKLLDLSALTAYDNHTDDTNEYHAGTPHFYPVQYGEAASVPMGDALVLCYPEMDNCMAEVVLDRFRRTETAQKLVHIGEFKGLTGTRKFEQLLLRYFKCDQRWPCRAWYTDAAEVSIWNLGRKSSDSPSLLVPCSWCSDKEARRRCKKIRSLSYCSESCFRRDFDVWQDILLLDKSINYSADYFEELAA